MSLVLALLLQTAAAPAPEPAWRSIGVHGGIDTAFDPASISREDPRVRVRIRGIAQAVGPDGIRIVTGLLDIDCTARTATSIEARGYDASGRLMLNAVVPPAERQAEPIRPQSPNAAVAAEVCRQEISQ